MTSLMENSGAAAMKTTRQSLSRAVRAGTDCFRRRDDLYAIYPMNPVHPYNGQTENHLIMLIPICAKTSGATNNNRAKNRV